MHDLDGVLDHDGVVQVGERVFVWHTLEEELVDIVVFDTVRHFLEEVARFSRQAYLDVELFLALDAELLVVERVPVEWAEFLQAA
mgnify:CR=1 FL=1